MPRGLVISAVLLGLTACAAPQPVLYPNTHFHAVGKEAAERDIAACKQLAEDAGATPEQDKGGQVAGNTAVGAGVGAATGVVGGAIAGAAGQGALIGAATGATAGLLQGIFSAPRPSPVYVQFVQRCLAERGYELVGWE